MRKYAIFLIGLLVASSAALALDQINIQFAPQPNTPYFVGQPEFNIDAEEFNTVILKIKSTKSGTARLFWATNFDPQMNQPKSIWFFVDRSNDFKEYSFNLRSQNGYWAGYVGQLLVYPENGPEGIEVGPSQAVVGNLGTNISSGWREFWGPSGRLVIGSTINTMASVNLFGRPITVYLYWLIVLAGLGYGGYLTNKWLAKKTKEPFASLWPQIGQGVVLTILFGWCLLEASNTFNLWQIVQQDARFVGKQIEEKRVLANTGDFYNFILFCQKNIPARARFDQRIPPIYNDIKAIYYLYPRKLSTTEAEYLVVYDQQPEANILRKYSPWQTFRPGALILKRGKS